jgi:tight adherence protein B
VGSVSTVLVAGLGALAGVGAFLVLLGARGVAVLATPRLASARDGLRRTVTPRLVAAGVVVLGVAAITGWPAAALLSGAAVVFGPHLLGGRASREKAVARTEAIASWTEMIRDSMAAASGLEEAISSTAPVAPGAIRPEVLMLVRRLERQSLPNALAAFGEAVAHPSADLVVAALTIAAQTEARDLSALLSRLAEAIRGEARMRIRVEVGRTRVRTASKIIVGVVAATVAVLALLNRGYLAAYDSADGQVVLLVVGGIFASGGWLLARMASLELPQRFSARPRQRRWAG